MPASASVVDIKAGKNRGIPIAFHCASPSYRTLNSPCPAIMELWKTENLMVLLFCAFIWLISYSYYSFIIPLPEQPSVPRVHSFPAPLIVLSLVSMVLQLNPVPIVVGGWIGQLLYKLLVAPHVNPTRNLPGPFLAKYTRFWKLVQVKKGTFHKTNQALHAEYGMNLGTSCSSCSHSRSSRSVSSHGT